MPRYFLNLRYRDRVFVDDEGEDLPDDAAATVAARKAARDLLAFGRMAAIRNWFDCSLEVVDGAGRLVLRLPFGEALGG